MFQNFIDRDPSPPEWKIDAIVAQYTRDPHEIQASLAAVEAAFVPLWRYYAITPEKLAVRYCENPSSLTSEEYLRLVHESDHSVWLFVQPSLIFRPHFYRTFHGRQISYFC